MFSVVYSLVDITALLVTKLKWVHFILLSFQVINVQNSRNSWMFNIFNLLTHIINNQFNLNTTLKNNYYLFWKMSRIYFCKFAFVKQTKSMLWNSSTKSSGNRFNLNKLKEFNERFASLEQSQNKLVCINSLLNMCFLLIFHLVNYQYLSS